MMVMIPTFKSKGGKKPFSASVQNFSTLLMKNEQLRVAASSAK
ncbi:MULTISPECIES: hypothetical protein [Brevibacillus]|nr:MULTISPECIES: hypothetical protein [Brevibacillus]MDH6351614.1 hypothetical protein [Brevibacillus sp. 1238]MED1722762.1 hypothetical protein [Brevibacillus parabrevis]